MIALTMLLAGSLAAAEPAPTAEPTALTAGRHAVSLSGLLCAVCSRAISAEWAKLPEAESAAVDFETGSAALTVRHGRTLQVASLRKALRRAERTANLGSTFEIAAIASPKN